MIHLDVRYSHGFIERYTNTCVPYIRGRLNIAFEELDAPLRDKLDLLFDEASLRLLLSSDASDLEVAANLIFNEVPILAERFNPKVFFDILNVDTDCGHLNLRTREGQQAIANIKNNVLTSVGRFLVARDSILLREFREEITQATKASDIKAKLKYLTKMINGDINATDAFIAKFPRWLESFSSAFNYDHLIAIFGEEIVGLIDLHYCPYCADESIEPFNGYRPAIDHYYPKSKFPFLALSLHNFVPAGDRCNSRFKRNNHMIGHFNPAHDELPNDALFHFEYPLDRDFSADDTKVTIENICEKLHKNSALFHLEDVYNKYEIRREFKNLYDRVSYLIANDNMPEDEEAIRLFLNVDLTISQKKVRYQKFLVDALNLLAGCNLVVNADR